MKYKKGTVLKWLQQFYKYRNLTLNQLENLEELYLSNNQISSIPKELGNLISLKELYLQNNPLVLPKKNEFLDKFRIEYKINPAMDSLLWKKLEGK